MRGLTSFSKVSPGKNERRLISLYPKKKALEIARLAFEKKAKDVVILNIKPLSTVADYLLVCSADSERQVEAIADSIESGMREKGMRPYGVEGVAEGRWALMDYSDVVAHIFHEPVRAFYDMEGLWADAEATAVKDTAEEKARKAAMRKETRKKRAL